MNYKLDEKGEPVLCKDILEFGKWFEDADRVVTQTQIGPAFVSTVFLGIDHGWGRAGGPVLWETMVFDLPGGEELQWRYQSKQAAAEHHKAVVAALSEGKPPPDPQL